MKLSSSLVVAVKAVSDVEEIYFDDNLEVITRPPVIMKPGRQWWKAWFQIFFIKPESENL